ncbi:hypothetical protein ABK040_002593 [Willaertia magna]
MANLNNSWSMKIAETSPMNDEELLEVENPQTQPTTTGETIMPPTKVIKIISNNDNTEVETNLVDIERVNATNTNDNNVSIDVEPVTPAPTPIHGNDARFSFDNVPTDKPIRRVNKAMIRHNREWCQSQRPEIMGIVQEELEHSDLTNFRQRLREMVMKHKEKIANRSRLRRIYNNFTKKLNYHKFPAFFSYINPFYRTVILIENRFGSGVAAYYEFFSSVIALNFLLSIISFLLLILPWLLRPTSSWPDIWQLRFLSGLVGFDSSVIGKSWFFFGGYEDRILLFNTVVWPFAFVYPFVVILFFALALIIISRDIGGKLTTVRRTDDDNKYLKAVFNSFSFNVTSKEAVRDLQKSIANKIAEFRNADFAKSAAVTKMSRRKLLILILRRVIGLGLSAIFLLGTPAAVYFMVEYYKELNAVFPYTTSVLSSAITIVFPVILSQLVIFEGYAHPSHTHWNIIFRTFIIKMSTTIALMVRVLFLQDSSLIGTCRQTEAGLVFWQMIWIEFGVNLVMTIIVMPIKYKVRQLISCAKDEGEEEEFEEQRKGKLEFEVPDNVIELLYRQSLIFVGSIMSPMIPIAGLVTNFVIYFVKYITMTLVCKFPDNPFERGRSSPFNQNMLLLTFILCLVPLGFFLFQPSGSRCGPFTASAVFLEQMPVEAAVNALSAALVFYSNENSAMTFERFLFYVSHKITLGSLTIFFFVICFFLYKFFRMFEKKYRLAEKRADIERKEKSAILKEYVDKTQLKY